VRNIPQLFKTDSCRPRNRVGVPQNTLSYLCVPVATASKMSTVQPVKKTDPKSWKWTDRRVSKDGCSFLFFYPAGKTLAELDDKLQQWFPEEFYDWIKEWNGDTEKTENCVTIFKHRGRWNRWVQKKRADGTWAKWYADFEVNGGKGVRDE